MRIFQGENINLLYVEVLNSLLSDGFVITKSSKKIKELYDCVIKIDNPKEGIILVEGRPYNPAFLIAETLWNLTGDTDVWLCNYNKLYKNYFTNNKLEAGYGNRIFNWDKDTNQFELVAKRLIEEPNTQHADIIIFNPSFDLRNPKFVPCITKLKFRIREDKLYMSSFMRAQDMWLGFPYDINLLLTIFQLMSIRIEKPMGELHHYCDVLRLYEANFYQAKKIRISETSTNNFIDLNKQCDFNKLQFYKTIIRELPENTLDIILKEPEYWQNGIKACLAYSLLHKGFKKDVYAIVDSMTNCFKNQFKIWALYYHNFHC